MSSDITTALRRLVVERAYHVCEYCLLHEDDSFWGCEIDHIISRKHGGNSEAQNLALACAVCNSNKGSDIATLVGKPRKLVRLFHPRSDRWLGCFHLNHAVIEAANDVGEASVNLLRFNQSERTAERRAFAEVGRYPTIQALARMKE